MWPLFSWLVKPKYSWSVFAAACCLGVFIGTAIAEPDEKEIGPPIPLITTPGCAPHAVLKEQLKKNYKEIPVAIGVSQTNLLVTIYASSLKDGNFTVVITKPGSESSCIVGAGTRFNFILAPFGYDAKHEIDGSDHQWQSP